MPDGFSILIRGEQGSPPHPTGCSAPQAGDEFAQLANAFNLKFRPLWTPSSKIAPATASLHSRPRIERRNRLSNLFKVTSPPDCDASALVSELSQCRGIQAAYRKPHPIPATANLIGHQGYLSSAPEGLNAKAAWKLPGGKGDGVKVLHIEYEWLHDHECTKGNITPHRVCEWPHVPVEDIHHGTAVISMIGACEHEFGITGIAPHAKCITQSLCNKNCGFDEDRATFISMAIADAIDVLERGDIIVVTSHLPGPRTGHRSIVSGSTFGYICPEWWPDESDAIREATDEGIVVVLAAGNGFQCLDDEAFDTPLDDFGQEWRNPFRRGSCDSGAIIVGAGAPPGHGDVDRSRLDFSNYGSVVDAQGWGKNIVTCGYGDLSGDKTDGSCYTKSFDGTSAAAPCVAGAIACLQGILRAQDRDPLTPWKVRELLRSGCGSPQQASETAPEDQRIGDRPDLERLVAKISSEPSC